MPILFLSLSKKYFDKHSNAIRFAGFSSQQTAHSSPRRKRQVSFAALLLLSECEPLRWVQIRL